MGRSFGIAIFGVFLSFVLLGFGGYCIYLHITAFEIGTGREVDPKDILNMTKTGVEYFVFPITFIVVAFVVSILAKGNRSKYAVIIALTPLSLLIFMGLFMDFRFRSVLFFLVDVFLAVLTTIAARKFITSRARATQN